MADQQGELPERIQSLSGETRRLFVELLDEPLVPLTRLRSEIEEYMELVEEKSYEYEFLDTVSARLIAEDFLEFLEEADIEPSSREHRLLQAGVRYFVENDDAEDDFTSPIGFDDDTEVKDLVLEVLTDERG